MGLSVGYINRFLNRIYRELDLNLKKMESIFNQWQFTLSRRQKEEILEMKYGNPPSFKDIENRHQTFVFIASILDANVSYVSRFLRLHAI